MAMVGRYGVHAPKFTCTATMEGDPAIDLTFDPESPTMLRPGNRPKCHGHKRAPLTHRTTTSVLCGILLTCRWPGRRADGAFRASRVAEQLLILRVCLVVLWYSLLRTPPTSQAFPRINRQRGGSSGRSFPPTVGEQSGLVTRFLQMSGYFPRQTID